MVQIRKDSNKSKSVARVHTVTGEPIQLLKEVGENKFIDEIEHKVYQLNPMTRVVVGV